MKAKVWLYSGSEAAWHFISLPKKESDILHARFSEFKRGWGSLPVVVTIGKTTWKTSIFADKKRGSYLLPLKAEIRKKNTISAGDTLQFIIEVLL